jgi:hypothetical protein
VKYQWTSVNTYYHDTRGDMIDLKDSNNTLMTNIDIFNLTSVHRTKQKLQKQILDIEQQDLKI